MERDRLQERRFELKFLISEAKAAAIRAFARCRMRPDVYSSEQEGNSYPVSSLYLDSRDLRTYWDTVNGIRNRFKLRVRHYCERAPERVFFEVKRRSGDIIIKQRCGVDPGALRDLLRGRPPVDEALASPTPDQKHALRKFSQAVLRLRARPQTLVSYRREAWVSDEDTTLRITFDRNIRSFANPAGRLHGHLDRSVRPFSPFVVLEVKFTGRCPHWLRDMIQRFELVRTSAAKYVEGVAALSPELLRSAACSPLGGGGSLARPTAAAAAREPGS